MASKFNCSKFLFIFSIIISIATARISSDVEYLREQYEARNSAADQIGIQYHNSQVSDGDVLRKADTQKFPYVDINVETDPEKPFFTLVMADPDAPQRGNEKSGPWLHWIQASFTGNDVVSGTTLADYQGPAPPDGTGPHQYIFLLYKGPDEDINLDGQPIAVQDSNKRRKFQLQNFEEANKLELVAATSFIVEGDDVKK